MTEQISRQTLDLLLNIILDVMKSKSGSIMLTDGTSPRLTIKSAKGLKSEIIDSACEYLGCGVSGKVASEETPLYIKKDDNNRRADITTADLVKNDDIDHSLIIPLKLNDGTVGTINVNAMDLTEEELAEKHELARNILGQFYNHLVSADPPTAHHSPPSELYMMNIFREYNVLRELKIVFDYIFELITDVSGIQKKGVFFLKNQTSDYFELVVGYGLESENYRTIYEELAPSIQARIPEPPRFMEIFNTKDLDLTRPGFFNEEFVVVFPLKSTEEGLAGQGQLVLFSHQAPAFEDKCEAMVKTICSRAAEVIHKSNLNQNFKDLTHTDSLTGTYNYGLWWNRLNEEVSRLQRDANGIMSLLVLDVDRFNKINISHGYYVGDQLLRLIADKIQGCVRTNDIVGRIGGEKFGVILIQSSKKSAMMIANRILDAMQRLCTEMRLELDQPLSLSGGISGFPMDADTSEGLVQKAQTAIVSAKIMGGNAVKLFDHMEE